MTSEKSSSGLSENLSSNLLTIGAIICAIVILAGFSLSYAGWGLFGSNSEAGTNVYKNENYGFSISLPTNWFILKHPGYENTFQVFENGPEIKPRSVARIEISKEKKTTLEQIRDRVETTVDNNENISFEDEGMKEVRNGHGLDFTLKFTSSKTVGMGRQFLLLDNNMSYTIATSVSASNPSYFFYMGENTYLKLKPDFDQMISSFKLS